MTERFEAFEKLYRAVYHSEIHGGEDSVQLSQSQCKF